MGEGYTLAHYSFTGLAGGVMNELVPLTDSVFCCMIAVGDFPRVSSERGT